MEMQVTNYISPTKKMNTEYGLITGEAWLQKEMKRMTKGKEVYFIKENDCGQNSSKYGYIALFRDSFTARQVVRNHSKKV